MTAPRNLRACPRCEALVERAASVCPYCGDSLAPPAPRAGSLLARPDLLSRALLAILVTVFILQVLATGGDGLLDLSGAEVIWMGGDDAAGLFHRGELWRLVSAIFLHAGIWHILFNGMALWQLGPPAERYWGRSRTLVLYLGTGIVAGLASDVYHYGMAAGWLAGIGLHEPWPPVSSLGASGAIFGLLGAVVGLSYRQRGLVGAGLTQLYRRWLVFALVFSLAVPFLGMPLDNAAHVGGLVAGLLFGRYVPNLRTRPESARARRAWAVLALAGWLLIVGCLGLALRGAVTQPRPQLPARAAEADETPGDGMD